MESPRIIKLPRDDRDSACVLVQVTREGPEPLDVCLEASEGEAPYFVSLSHERIASSRSENAPVSGTEWQDILHSILSQEALPDIHATASVQSGTAMSITVRKQIQGITQRLGSICLSCDPERELDIFQWCAVSQDALLRSSEALAASAARAKELELTVRELRTQLDDLISTKQADEAQLLQRFSELLNEKKVKIRQQAKIIAAARDAPQPPSQQQQQQHRAAPEPEPSPQPPPRRKAAKSRGAKRKAVAQDSASSADEQDPGAMDVDKIKSEPEDDHGGVLYDSDATASGPDVEDNDDDDDDNVGVDQDGRSGQARPQAVDTSHAGQRGSDRKVPEEAPPAPRSLPFARKKALERIPVFKQADPGTDSEDDEL